MIQGLAYGFPSPDAQDSWNPRALACAPGKESEAIALLLEEYKALRVVFGQYIAARVQLLGFVGILTAVLAAMGGFRLGSPILYVGLAVAVLGLWAWRTTNGAAQRLGLHLHEVEQRLNELAARAYGAQAPLFGWEGVRQRRRADDPRLVQLFRRFIG